MPLGPIVPSGAMSTTIFADPERYQSIAEVNTAFVRAFNIIDTRCTILTSEIAEIRRGNLPAWSGIALIFGWEPPEIAAREIDIKTKKIAGLNNIRTAITAYQSAEARGDVATINSTFRDFRRLIIQPGDDLIRASEFSLRTKDALRAVAGIIEGIYDFYEAQRRAASVRATSSAVRGAFVEMPASTSAVGGAPGASV